MYKPGALASPRGPLPGRRAAPMLVGMDAMSAVGGTQGAQAPVDLKMLKKGQDLAKDQAAQLLAALPPPQSPSPPGVGGNLDMMA